MKIKKASLILLILIFLAMVIAVVVFLVKEKSLVVAPLETPALTQKSEDEKFIQTEKEINSETNLDIEAQPIKTIKVKEVTSIKDDSIDIINENGEEVTVDLENGSEILIQHIVK